MLKTLLIIALVIYLLYKVGLLRFTVHGQVNGQDTSRNFHRKTNGNVNIDSVPPKEKQRKNFTGGEYVDYEEVK